jgi:hypothetical protein
MTTSSRMHCQFLRLLFLQAHRETTAHVIATGLPSQQNRSDNAFRFKREAFYMDLKSKVGLVSAKASALRINLNIQGCSAVAPSLHAPSRAPSSPPPPFTQYPSPPRSLVRDVINRVPPRGWDGCTFVGADLRVCGLWVRSRSLAAIHAGGPGSILLPA